MSSWHIRATKIKHASPPSAGWLLSLGLKTAVTHEQSPQTKTCTLCKWWRETARTVNTHIHTHTPPSAVFFACSARGSLAPKLFVPRTYVRLLRIALGFATSPPPATSVPGSALVTFDDATLATFPAVQLIDHPLALQSGALRLPLDQLAFF